MPCPPADRGSASPLFVTTDTDASRTVTPLSFRTKRGSRSFCKAQRVTCVSGPSMRSERSPLLPGVQACVVFDSGIDAALLRGAACF